MERPPSVLLVDDERGIRMALERLLVSSGFEVVAVESGEQALAALQSPGEVRRFDVILTDLEMPGMHGLELIRSVRRRDALVPIVVLTGHRDGQGTAELTELGVLSCLDKPVSVDVLIGALRGAMIAVAGSCTNADWRRIERAPS